MRRCKRGAYLWKKSRLYAAIVLTSAGCKKATDTSDILIYHVGGKPYRNQAVIPFTSVSVQSGWWQQSPTSCFGDTIWSDENGRATLRWPRDYWDGVMIPLNLPNSPPNNYCIKFSSNHKAGSEHTYFIPGGACIQFVGDRIGNSAQSGFWLFRDWESATIRPDRWITPGSPHAPSVLLHHWVHPEESLPVLREHYALTPNGQIHTLPPVLIREEMIGDTTSHSVIH